MKPEPPGKRTGQGPAPRAAGTGAKGRHGAPWPVRASGVRAPNLGASAGRRGGAPPGGAGPAGRSWLGGRRSTAAAQAAREQEELRQGVRRRGLFLSLVSVVLVIGATNVLLGAVGLIQETRSRPLTDAERAEYVRQDVARRWHSWPAAMVFPDEVEYIGLGRSQRLARRVGIAPEASCRSGLDAPVAGVLQGYGCRTLLRATYVDQSASYAITVGVAVLRDEESRVAAAARLPVDDRVGVRPVSFPGTVTESFGAAQRQRTAWVGAGPYIVFTASGYADGRTRQAVPPEEILHSELWPVAQSIGGRIARALGQPPDVPRCTQGNVC
jgi:hypothetical protein